MDRLSVESALEAKARGTVAVHEAASEDAATEVAARLLGADIPAAVELEKVDAAWVIVPWDKQGEAEQILRRWGLAVIPRFGAGGGFDLPTLPRRDARPELSLLGPGDGSAVVEAEIDDGPVEVALPESGPVTPRLVVALSAVGFGVGVQRALEAVFGPAGATSAMAAKGSAITEVWRYVTAGFYHFSLGHLGSNLAFGLLFGVVLFGTHGVGAAMLAWLVASVVGIGTEVAFSPAAVVVAGASAGNYGLAGLWARGQVDRARRAFLPRRERIKALGVVLVLAPGALTPVTSTGTKVAVLAHAAGFIAGYLIGDVFPRRVVEAELPGIDRRSRSAQWIAIAFVAAAFLAGLRQWILG